MTNQPRFYFGGARSKRIATLRNVPKLLFWDRIGHAKSAGFGITSISLIYSLTYWEKKGVLFWLSRGLSRLTCVTLQIRRDSKLRASQKLTLPESYLVHLATVLGRLCYEGFFSFLFLTMIDRCFKDGIVA